MIERRTTEESERIRLGEVQLDGVLSFRGTPLGVVLFAHGSGSSRHSPRNQQVAGELRQAGLGTLLVDLLTAEEDSHYARRFDIPFLAERLANMALWLRARLAEKGLRIGLFGSSTGAAAALWAAVDLGGTISAVVSRGGRPDLVEERLPEVEAPTLLIVGGNDEPVTSLNVSAYRSLRCPKELAVIPGATHLFEEPGALEDVSRRTAGWFRRFLPAPPEVGPTEWRGPSFRISSPGDYQGGRDEAGIRGRQALSKLGLRPG